MFMELVQSLPTVLGASATVPPLLALWLVITLDKRPEPPHMVWGAFVLGAATIFLLRYVRLPFAPMLEISQNPWAEIVLRALFWAAIPEETVKIAVIVLIATRRVFNEPMDGVVYGAAAGLGFATYENLSYLVEHSDNWQALAVVRSMLTVPFHAALGIIAGAYIAGGKFGARLGGHRRERFARFFLYAAAWCVPVLIHMLFDIPLMALREKIVQGEPAHTVLQMSGLLVGGLGIAFAIRLALRIAARQREEKGPRAPAEAWRSVWLLLIASGAAGFVGAALITLQIKLLRLNGDLRMSAVILGLLLLWLGLAGFVFGRRNLLKAAEA